MSVYSPNQSFCNYDFLEKSMITLLSDDSVTTQWKLRASLYVGIDNFLGIFLIWFINPLGVMFHQKSVCNFIPRAIFGKLIVFRHGVTKTQILSKVPTKTIKMIRNKWIGTIWASISFKSDFLDLWLSFSHVTA